MSSSQPSLPLTDAALPDIGSLLVGKYRIEKVLGRGGMGIVYAATHELLCQRVAVKLLLSEAAKSPDAASRFLNEARAAARIQAENVARVSDVGTLESGIPYMVMEFLEGSDLNDLLAASGPMPIPQAVDYLLQAIEAVAQAHTLGIVHRDLKPANLFLARRLDGTSLVKVLDFGISKTTGLLGEASSNTSTQTMLGSPYYMSPEQLRSSKNVDRRTDIWSIGVILYELITGTQPYKEETLGGLFAAILENEPPPLAVLRPDAPPGLDAVYRKCLMRNPDQRYQSAQELAYALTPFATPRGRASIDRITSLAPALGSISQSQAAVGAITGRGQTAATWGTSGATTAVKPASRTPALVAVVAGCLALVGGGIFIARTFLTNAAPAAASSAQPSNTEHAVAAPTPSAAETAAPTAATAAAPSATPSAAPTETAAAPAASSASPSVEPPKPPTAAAAPQFHGKKPAPHAPAANTASQGYDPSKDTRR